MFIKSSTFSVYLDVRTKFDNVSSQYKADLMRVSYFLSENERSSDENRFLQINISLSDEYFFFILKIFNQVLFLLFNSVHFVIDYGYQNLKKFQKLLIHLNNLKHYLQRASSLISPGNLGVNLIFFISSFYAQCLLHFALYFRCCTNVQFIRKLEVSEISFYSFNLLYSCFFHGFQSTLSLACILGSIFSVKNFVFGKFSDYNINLVMVLVTSKSNI